MKQRYSIGLFVCAMAAVALLFGAAYNYSYKKAEERMLAKQEIKQKTEETIITDGEAKKSEGYVLLELNGFVAVYLSDRTTIYEYTNISINSLPQDTQAEIKEGKVLKSLGELYGFLENYSS